MTSKIIATDIANVISVHYYYFYSSNGHDDVIMSVATMTYLH
jgi:hypothetical protein